MVLQQRLTSVLYELAAIVNDDFTVDDAARVLLTAVPRVLHVDGAGIAVLDDDRRLRFVQAVPEPVELLDRIQEEEQAGPSFDVLGSGEPANATEIGSARHWPTPYRDRARATGLLTATTFPLTARGAVWGALTLYRSSTEPMTEEEMATGLALAQVAAGYLVLAADRDALRTAQLELSRRAMYDQLTDLPRRWVLVDHVDRALSWLRRNDGHVGMLFVDLDGLKYVNDTHGHAAGDHLVRVSAEALRDSVRPTDVVARVGGDEFVVLLPELTAPETAEQVAGRVVTAIAATAQRAGITSRVCTASVGVVTTSDASISADTLISHADAAMYQAKRAGGGRYSVFDPGTYAALTGRHRLRAKLTAALDLDQFELHYQPIMGLEDGSLHGVEALLRWHHPDRGLIAAGEFIDALEGTDLIGDVGAWVLRTACAQMAAWDREHPDSAPTQLFVNLSAGELAHPGVGDRIRTALSASGLAGERLVLEITETEGLSSSFTRTAATLTRLQAEHGCRFAIDDYGTGHSSLNRLVQLPVDIIKIDQTFTSRLFSSDDIAPVVSSLTHLAERTGREIVVEGIEDAPSRSALLELGCRYGQGYHLARPQPHDALSAYLRSSAAP